MYCICYKWLIWFVLSLVFQVGILDVDLCVPSIPRIMNVEGKDILQQCSFG